MLDILKQRKRFFLDEPNGLESKWLPDFLTIKSS